MINTRLNDLTKVSDELLIDTVKCLHYSMYLKPVFDSFSNFPSEQEIRTAVDAELISRGIDPYQWRHGIGDNSGTSGTSGSSGLSREQMIKELKEERIKKINNLNK